MAARMRRKGAEQARSELFLHRESAARTGAVDLEHGLPLLVSGLVDDAVPRVARIVHQDVQLAKLAVAAVSIKSMKMNDNEAQQRQLNGGVEEARTRWLPLGCGRGKRGRSRRQQRGSSQSIRFDAEHLSGMRTA